MENLYLKEDGVKDGIEEKDEKEDGVKDEEGKNVRNEERETGGFKTSGNNQTAQSDMFARREAMHAKVTRDRMAELELRGTLLPDPVTHRNAQK